jgi:bis(5'-nucleosyl)-tetraphosphatase (symmetrical)
MYGNEPPGWRKKLAGYERLRVITNYLTRMRFVDARGDLELRTKGEAGGAPDGYMPWFSHPDCKQSPRVLFGHWAALDGNTGRDNAVALDTGCVWGGRLTALRLEDNRRFSCRCG